jgi:hypothetical protein
MPVHKIKMPNGKEFWQFGNSGAVYPTKEKAQEQARAIYASGYKETTLSKGKK